MAKLFNNMGISEEEAELLSGVVQERIDAIDEEINSQRLWACDASDDDKRRFYTIQEQREKLSLLRDRLSWYF